VTGKRNPPGTPDPRLQVEVAVFARFPDELGSNASYMRGELENLGCSSDRKARIEHLCVELEGLAYDLRAEVYNLQDKLGLRPGEEPWDPDIANPDPRVTLGFFRDWPGAVFEEMNDLVQTLNKDGEKEGSSLHFMLVAESGANMLNAHKDVLDAIERIEALLQENASRP
jgi:hypothetical protein